MEKPKHTLLFNMESTDGFTSRCRTFFTDRKTADIVFNTLSASGQCPTIRPYHGHSDRQYLVDYKKPIKIKK